MAAETAVFGAALGTGTTLLIAVTIIMYKYYRLKRKTKEWHSLDQMPFPVVTEKNSKPFYPYPRTVSFLFNFKSGITYLNFHCNITEFRE